MIANMANFVFAMFFYFIFSDSHIKSHVGQNFYYVYLN